jgi:hypothetical protein
MELLNIILYLFVYFGIIKAQYDKYIIKKGDTCYDIINK